MCPRFLVDLDKLFLEEKYRSKKTKLKKKTIKKDGYQLLHILPVSIILSGFSSYAYVQGSVLTESTTNSRELCKDAENEPNPQSKSANNDKTCFLPTLGIILNLRKT